MFAERPVIVLQLPRRLIAGTARPFFDEIKGFLKSSRPRIVFDLSEVTHLDSAGVQMLLNSMEEVMKGNGDLKLAAIAKGPANILEVTRVESLFEIYPSVPEAVGSFYRLPVVLPAAEPWGGCVAPT